MVFLDNRERLFLRVLAPWLEFVVIVDLLLSLRIHNSVVVSGYWLLRLALGLSKVLVQFSCGSSQLVKLELVDIVFPSGSA